MKLFGTDGIRGRAGEFPLDRETVFAIGRSVATVMVRRSGRKPKFVVGRDTRESGPWIEQAFLAGALSAETTGESAGIITTPGVAFLTGDFGFDVGIVISASHNPFDDNGIKVFLPSGQKLGEEAEREIETLVEEMAGSDESVRFDVDASRADDFRNSYLDHLSSQFPDLRLEGYRVVVDCANGAASDFAPALFERFGAKVTTINASPTGRNINDNCGSLHLDGLKASVLENKAAFGVAFDGDADRALFVDEKGIVVDGDATMFALANDLRSKGELKSGKVVATVMSNVGLEIALKERNVELVRTDVGDKYVLEELLRGGTEIGGEQSGHIILPKTSLVGDGMMTALFMLNALHSSGGTFSEMVSGITRYPQILVNVPVKEKIAFAEVTEIALEARAIESELNGTGRLLLRYSGTEDLARVMIEGKDGRKIETLANRLAEVIRSTLG